MSLDLRNQPGEPDDFEVFHGQLQVGRIYKRSAIGARSWLWALNGVFGGPSDLAISGAAATQAEALTALDESWSKWLNWAELKERS